MADPAPQPQQPKGLNELRQKQPEPELEAIPDGGEGDGQPQGNLQSVPTPRRGVDVGGVPAQKPATPPGPQGPATAGGGQGDGRPRGQLAAAPTAQPADTPDNNPANEPGSQPVRPDNAPPVDTDAVGEPLPETATENDDQDDRRPDPRDFRDEEQGPDEGEGGGENGEPESGSPRDGAESADQSGEETSTEAGEPEAGGAEAGAGGAEAAGAGAGAAEAGAGAAEGAAAGAGEAELEKVGARVLIMNPEVWAPIALAAVIVMLCVLGLIVIMGMAGGASSGSGGSAGNQNGGSAANNFGGANGFPFPKGSGFEGPDTWAPDQGIDINANGGTPELAVGDGTIVSRGIGGFGDWAPVLKLDQPINGKYHYVYYGHAGCGKNDNGPTNAGQRGHGTPQCPEVGSKVKQGDQIAVVGFGNVGQSFGPHLEIGFSDSAGTPIGTQTSGDMKAYLLSHLPK